MLPPIARIVPSAEDKTGLLGPNFVQAYPVRREIVFQDLISAIESADLSHQPLLSMR